MSRRTEIIEARDTDLFETMRPRLLGIGYRILGTLSEAEDAAQGRGHRSRLLLGHSAVEGQGASFVDVHAIRAKRNPRI